MKILLLSLKPPDSIRPQSCYQRLKTSVFHNFMLKVSTYSRNLALSVLAAVTPCSHEVEVVEEEFEKINFDDDYNLVGISCTTFEAPLVYKVADEFRKRGVFVVLGGWHPSALPEEAIKHADSVVIGEAEETWPQLVKDAEKGKLKKFYIQDKPVEASRIPKPLILSPDGMLYSIQATRGCKNRCNFCAISNTKFRGAFRARPIDSVIEEIMERKEKYLVFQDPSMTVNPEYTKRLFKRMIGFNKKFVCNGNVDVLSTDDELLRLASDAGCMGWLVGFESISQETINGIGKRTNKIEDYHNCIKKLHDHDMFISASFVFGFDTDTKDVFDETYAFVTSSEIDIPDAMILTPFPGTPLYSTLKKEDRILTEDWSKYDFEHVVFKPLRMPPEDLYRGTKNLYQSFFTSGKILSRTLKAIRLGYQITVNVFMQNLLMQTRRYKAV